MRVSQLCELSGVPLPSIKYYLREGLLPAGERTSATQAVYDESHVERLRLIRALLEVGGLSVATAQRVLAAIDFPDLPLSHIFGVAQYAVSDAALYEEVDAMSPGLAHVDATIERMGWSVTDENPGRHGAARILDTYAALGQTALSTISPEYAQAAELVAAADLAAVARSTETADMAETVVVGTVLGDGLLASLRRIAQENLAHQNWAQPRSEK